MRLLLGELGSFLEDEVEAEDRVRLRSRSSLVGDTNKDASVMELLTLLASGSSVWVRLERVWFWLD